MIKMDVVSGFLGSGKTTLIQKLFSSKLANEKVVLIENEFGEIGIDGSFLNGSGIDVKEINSGCICCSLVGDFSESIKEVISKYNPDRIIIEPSGVGKLSDIVNAINNVDAELKVNVLVTVVDGAKAKLYMKNFGEFFNNQIEAAQTIVVSKTDKIAENKLLETLEMIKEKNEHANYITTSLKDIDADYLLNVLEKNVGMCDEMIGSLIEEEHECCCGHHHEEEHECCCGHDHHEEEHECCCGHDHHESHHHHHDADEVFVSMGITTPKAFSYSELETFLKELSQNSQLGIVLRAKGILKASDCPEWYHFDFVSGDYEIRKGGQDVIGRTCVIGSKLDKVKIENIFYGRV